MAEQLLPVVRVGEIPSEPNAQRWLVEGLWGASSVGVIGGAPKCAKTWLGLDMALSVATGTACLGKYAVPEPGPVLVYLAEDALPIVRERVEGMARHRGLDLAGVEIHVITAPVLRLDRDRDRARLWETARRLRPRLLLLDPLVRLHGIDENHAGEVAELLAYFRSLQRQLDLSVLLVHHTRKNAAGGAAGQGLRGSGDIHAFGDSNLYLRRTREHLVLSSEHRARRQRRRSTLELVATDAETTHLEVVGELRGGPTKLTRTGSSAASRNGCSTFWAGAKILTRAQAPRFAWRSRTSVSARRWSRSSEQAELAARPLVGNAWPDQQRRAVPVPYREMRGNGTASFRRAPGHHRVPSHRVNECRWTSLLSARQLTRRGTTMPGVDFDRVCAEITMEQVLALLGFQPLTRSGAQWYGSCPLHESTLGAVAAHFL